MQMNPKLSPTPASRDLPLLCPARERHLGERQDVPRGLDELALVQEVGTDDVLDAELRQVLHCPLHPSHGPLQRARCGRDGCMLDLSSEGYDIII